MKNRGKFIIKIQRSALFVVGNQEELIRGDSLWGYILLQRQG